MVNVPTASSIQTPVPLPSNIRRQQPAKPHRRTSARTSKISVNPDVNGDVLDAPDALRASPDGEADQIIPTGILKPEDVSDSPLSDIPEPVLERKKRKVAHGRVSKSSQVNEALPPELSVNTEKLKNEAAVPGDLEIEGEEQQEEADEEEIKSALSRPLAVNSEYLPLPWKGRLGYACLNTYLRYSNPPVFSSRTCRIASILEHRHPLKDPSKPEHATKNRPDKDQPADIAKGQAYVESIGLANARDIIKMLKWNDRYGIKFMRLSSEMFPFASHEEYGYKLSPFAKETLKEVGKVVADLGHRVTTHPGQFTQLGSPRQVVIENAIRDLEYHDEMLSLLELPPQMDRDAVMILHLGGVFGDKAATLDRFRENYRHLSPSIKKRLVLENDDVSWSVHDLLPLCQEMNIPLVLDFHHHNIIFDADKIREGTKDIIDLYPAILETWKRKKITPKMHYSEPTPSAITGRDRRKHAPRVSTLPPCPDTMDLMIEAKDKEQAVFELMRTFKLPGFDRINDMIPHARNDDNKPVRVPAKKKAPSKKKAQEVENGEAEESVESKRAVVPESEVGMGGPEGRVYWPPGMEEWLRPVKRVLKRKDEDEAGKKSVPPKKATGSATSTVNPIKVPTVDLTPNAKRSATKTPIAKKRARAVPTPSTSDEDEDDLELKSEGIQTPPPLSAIKQKGERKSARTARKINYAEDPEEI
ncbi:UV-endonuclease UvdE [Patellaria atrata CBS 101060]|uniref:UV-endonuclease UvdE n=1 Tax=Patellaria atrata CBS 101060 TaxID=1346257 RepID=A0A9P4VRT9_9PEZI|nr:UV-endonuclease UvdE [Patellaria atrata CBS 101060]